MTHTEIIAQMRADLANNIIKIVNNDGYRYYTDVLTETIIVPLTTPQETAETYEKLFINKSVLDGAKNSDLFDTLPRVSMFFGPPDTGKTTAAINIAKDCGVKMLFKMCGEALNLETLFSDFKLVDGKPAFLESLAIKFITGMDRCMIVIDEFNTLLTGVMKTFQPIMDDTSTTFEYNGVIYTKNMNCKFIVTLNNKDKGISVMPDAIISRALLTPFEAATPSMISKWTGVDLAWVTNLQSIYKALDVLNIFGTRQVKMLYSKPTNMERIKKHLLGLCIIKNIDTKLFESLPVQALFNKL